MENTVIPMDNSPESIKVRKQIIYEFYQKWKSANPLMRRYNFSLKENINIRHISIDETSTHASKRYLSTLAVMQLDSILSYAVRKKTVQRKQNKKNQKMFEKIQYCITALGI